MPCRELRFVLSVVFYVVSENPQNCIGSKSCRNQKKTPEIRRFQVFLELLGGFPPNGALHFTFLPAYLPEDSAPYICPPEDPRFAEVVAYMEKITKIAGIHTSYGVNEQHEVELFCE